ncbi:MAG: YaiO family outer membrane beta-barrel protein [Bacteroidales bacterium]|nr:YaiO family outer membrane beta-barrel protein [Bacteroidales bacterium]MBN2699738.1 YaiO family outer membrane beta-barrel protein [Bacteroidales bacterium]
MFLHAEGFSQAPPVEYANPEEGFDLIRVAASEGDYARAKRIGNQILESNPEYHDVSIYLARVYGWDSRFDSAYAILEHVMAVNPELPEAYSAYVDLCYWQNDWNRLKSIAGEAISHTDSDDVRSKYALALYHTGEIQEAVAQADSVLADDPGQTLAGEVKRLSVLKSELKELFVHYSFDYFEAPYNRRWHMVTAGCVCPFSSGKLIPYINAGTNAGKGSFIETSDIQMNLEAYLILTKRNYMLAGYGISPGNYFPAHRAILDIWQILPAGFSLSAGVRYFYWDSHFVFWALGVEKYLGTYWLALKNYLFNKDYGFSSSHYFTIRRYFNSSFDYLSLTLGYGTAPDEPVVVISDLERLNAASIRIDLSKQVRSSIRLNISSGYSYEEYENQNYRNRFNFRIGSYIRF